ncbi:energy transducer TonB [Stigmatella erecta]|uniref:Outer membrane transport energization protein TonB n=1 Tax=Stigmatella erecta TaxID=83460 RepID=A0A1I0L575_9BACT|nr:energy transducer TonB [Stigmatella erecta]SEU34631.1 outer membrane transport energization protein TonB [Stigmatella erecta]
MELHAPGPGEVQEASARERLFRMGEPSRGERERWGWALVLAVLVHGAGVGLWLMMPAEARQVAPPEAPPELVFMQFAPPPAASAPAPQPVQAERVKPRTKVLTPQPVIPRTIPQEPPKEVPVEAPVEPEPAVAAPEVAAEAAPVADSAGVTGGVAGGVVNGQEGGLVGATGDALQLKQVARAPGVLQQVPPRYPRAARSEGIEGLVLVRVIIGTDGRIEPGSMQVLRSVAALDEAALAAVSQWRFSPALGHQGKPVRVIVEIPIQFSLK